MPFHPLTDFEGPGLKIGTPLPGFRQISFERQIGTTLCFIGKGIAQQPVAGQCGDLKEDRARVGPRPRRASGFHPVWAVRYSARSRPDTARADAPQLASACYTGANRSPRHCSSRCAGGTDGGSVNAGSLRRYDHCCASCSPCLWTAYDGHNTRRPNASLCRGVATGAGGWTSTRCLIIA